MRSMDYLRDAIWQQVYAQREPIGVYRPEGFTLFPTMLGEIRREVTSAIFDTECPTSSTKTLRPNSVRWSKRVWWTRFRAATTAWTMERCWPKTPMGATTIW